MALLNKSSEKKINNSTYSPLVSLDQITYGTTIADAKTFGNKSYEDFRCGLHGTAKVITANTDLNTITGNGWYDFNTYTNGPSFSSGSTGTKITLFVACSGDANYCTQIAYPCHNNSNGAGSIFGATRRRFNGTWGPWRYLAATDMKVANATHADTATTSTNVSGSGSVTANNITSNNGRLETKGTSSSLPQLLFHIPSVTYTRLVLGTDGVIHVQEGGSATYRNIKAANFIGHLTGTADYATNVLTKGRKNAADLPNTYPDGISCHEVYNNSYPCNFGNTLTIKGLNVSVTQFCMEWSGTTGAKGRIWIRNSRDNTNQWSGWTQLAGDGYGVAGNATKLDNNTQLTYGWSGINYFNANLSAGTTANANVAPKAGWHHIIRMNHANSSGYLTDLAVGLNDNDGFYWRTVRGGTSTAWFRMCDSNNSTAFTAGSALGLRNAGDKNSTFMKFHWSGQSGQPAWLWGGNTSTDMYVWNPSNFNVANANTVGGLGVNGTVNTGANKVVRTQANGYIHCGYINSNTGVENGNIANIIYDNGDGYYRKCSLAHLINKINGAIPGGRIWIE